MKARLSAGLLVFLLVTGLVFAAPDDDAARKLLLEAQRILDVDKDPAGAQQLLEQAYPMAVSNDLRGKILFELAYTAWFRLDPTARVRELLEKAASLMGSAAHPRRVYAQEFLQHWKQVSRARKPRGPRRFRVDCAVQEMATADSRFAVSYGRWHMLPEVRLALRIHSHWFAWISGARFSARGEISIVEREVSGIQQFLAIGAGWEGTLGSRFSLFLAAGPQMAWFEEESRMDRISRQCLGFLARADLEWRHQSGFFIFFTAGYGGASYKLPTHNIRAGGVRAGCGLGVSF